MADDGTWEICAAIRSAIKWMRVSCFVYMSSRNATFGRIEAHAAITAFGRDTLLRAKKMVEGRGFEILHALTGSLWITKPGTTERELRDLYGEIRTETKI